MRFLLEGFKLLQGSLVLAPLGLARPTGEAVSTREVMLVAAQADRTSRAFHLGFSTGVASGPEALPRLLFSSACGCCLYHVQPHVTSLLRFRN
jgi:hypothetical protein